MIQGGNRGNIIPDSVIMQGTIRTYDEAMRADIHKRITRTVQDIAHSAGATAVVRISTGGLVTVNDPALTAWALPVDTNLREDTPWNFSSQRRIPAPCSTRLAAVMSSSM